MQSMTPLKRKILFVLPIISTLLSLVSSITLMIMILKSKRKLSSSYRRLIFGLSSLDAIYCLGNVFSSLPVPKSTNVWGALGNQGTCDVQGFLLYVGISGVPMYTLSLCVFYYHSITKFVSNATFVKRIEPFLRVVPYTWALSGALFHLAKGNYNPGADYLVCWVGPYPPVCHFEDIPCIRGANAHRERVVWLGTPIAVICVILVTTMSLITWKVYRLEKQTQKYQYHLRDLHPSNHNRNGQGNGRARRFSFSFGASSSSSSKKNRAVMSQSCLYVLAYLLSYVFPSVNTFVEKSHGNVPFPLRLLGRTLSPAQGFINMLVYTRPHVRSLRKMCPDYSWLKAFIAVVKSGGDNDGNLDMRRRLSRISVRMPSTLDNDIDCSLESEEEQLENEYEKEKNIQLDSDPSL